MVVKIAYFSSFLKSMWKVLNQCENCNTTTTKGNPSHDIYNPIIMAGIGHLHLSLLANPAPTNFKRLRVEKYERLTKLRDHVCTFLSELQWFTFRDDILWRAFQDTLKDTAYQWFVDLHLRPLSLFLILLNYFSPNMWGQWESKRGMTS